MPRGKYVNHKGRNRHFTSPEELEEERKNQDKKKFNKGGEESNSDSDEEEVEEGDDSSEDSDDEDDVNKKSKGVAGLIDIENPNRVQKKAPKVSTLVPSNTGSSSSTSKPLEEKPELSRREREEIEKQRSQAHYQKLHAEGKTEQARADLARLAIIKQNRLEAAARREQEKKEKEERKKGGSKKI